MTTLYTSAMHSCIAQQSEVDVFSSISLFVDVFVCLVTH